MARPDCIPCIGPGLAVLDRYGASVQAASARNPSRWQIWWWVCLAGQIVFLPFIFVMTGRWRPKRAQQDLIEHDRRVARQLTALFVDASLPC